MSKFISAKYTRSTLTVQYLADNGDILLRSGGTIPWRFNNPGDVRPSKVVKTAIGSGNTGKNGTFSIFPDYQTGRKEAKALLRRAYNDKTISSAMYKYAPPSENNTEAYISYICTKTGLPPSTPLSSMSDSDLDSMVDAIEKYEGFYDKTNRHEKWIHTAAVTLSDGTKPLAKQPVIVKTNGKEKKLETDNIGQLPLLPLTAGQTIELSVPTVLGGLKSIGSIPAQQKSTACLFTCDLQTVQESTHVHYASDITPGNKPIIHYKIISGDTLSAIASKFKTSVSELKKDNNLTSDLIFPGDYLVINAEASDSDDNVTIEVDDESDGDSDAATTESNAATTTPAAAPTPAATTPAKPVAASTPAHTPASKSGAARVAAPASHNSTAHKPATPVRSNQGTGHPIAAFDATSPEAPWMAAAIGEAKRWHGQDEKVITKGTDYHELVGDNMHTLVGNAHPWCAAFVNWCLHNGNPPYPMSTVPESRRSSQIFRTDKNFRKIDKPIYGAIAVYSHGNGKGHVGLVYAKSKSGGIVLLSGNWDDRIAFADKATGLKENQLAGYYVPSTYLKHALDEIKSGPKLMETTATELNNEIGISRRKKHHTTR